MFDLADSGQQVVIRRRGKRSYMLTPVYDDDFQMTPALEARLEEGREEYRQGKTIHCETIEELNAFLDSLTSVH